MEMTLRWRKEDGARLAATVWRTGPGLRTISSAMVGGGIGPVGWVLNAQVAGGYARTDPVEHLLGLAASYGLSGRGVGMLTAASVDRTMVRSDGGVIVSATVGLRVPTWAAVPEGTVDTELAPILLPPAPPGKDTPGTEPPDTEPPDVDVPVSGMPVVGALVAGSGVVDAGTPGSGAVVERRPGTVNIVVHVPVALSDAALVNAVMTATEAKTQALLEAGYPCTGTASDAICVVAPIPRAGEEEPFAGPRSVWGGRVARAVYAAVHAGALDYTGHLKRRGS